MKKILLIATGGTIACTATEAGLAPVADADSLLDWVPELRKVCHLVALSLMAIDSTNMTPQYMARIARAIFDHYQDFDGFVVTHGTDTLGYTSAALTYMLPQIGKPVVLTGSQLAMEAPDTDARQNLTDALQFVNEGQPGIYVVFNGKVINGTRAMKVKTHSMDAFASINAPLVAEIASGQIRYLEQLKMTQAENALPALLDRFCPDVFLLKISPCIRADIFDLISRNYRGLIIEGFGIGGIPGHLLAGIQRLIEAGIAVVIATQCLEEGVDLGIYQVGQELAQHDVIYAGDMNSEALVMKLMWALGNYDNLCEVKQFMETPVGGDRLQ